MAAKLQADIRNTNGQFNRVVPGGVYREHHKKVAPIKDFSYRGRMFDPSYVPVGPNDCSQPLAYSRVYRYLLSITTFGGNSCLWRLTT